VAKKKQVGSQPTLHPQQHYVTYIRLRVVVTKKLLSVVITHYWGVPPIAIKKLVSFRQKTRAIYAVNALKNALLFNYIIVGYPFSIRHIQHTLAVYISYSPKAISLTYPIFVCIVFQATKHLQYIEIIRHIRVVCVAPLF